MDATTKALLAAKQLIRIEREALSEARIECEEMFKEACRKGLSQQVISKTVFLVYVDNSPAGKVTRFQCGGDLMPRQLFIQSLMKALFIEIKNSEII